MADSTISTSESSIVEILSRQHGRARFVVEIEELQRRAGAPAHDTEQALTALEQAGTILIRPHGCADPHLDGADLRIAALVPHETEDGDPQSSAICKIDETWQRWLGDYLANHRCM
jgi:hypothetical protein